MKIHCTILRKNGTWKTVHVDAKKRDFECDGYIYELKSYRMGRLFGVIPWLTSYYVEGIPQPLEFDVDKELKKIHLKIDGKAIKNLTNKKIIDVFGEMELTRLEQYMLMVALATIALGVINFFMNMQILDKFPT